MREFLDVYIYIHNIFHVKIKNKFFYDKKKEEVKSELIKLNRVYNIDKPKNEKVDKSDKKEKETKDNFL